MAWEIAEYGMQDNEFHGAIQYANEELAFGAFVEEFGASEEDVSLASMTDGLVELILRPVWQ